MSAIACGCWSPQERFRDLPATSVSESPPRPQRHRARSISPSIAAQALHSFRSERQSSSSDPSGARSPRRLSAIVPGEVLTQRHHAGADQVDQAWVRARATAHTTSWSSDLGPSPRVRFPMPIATKADSVPTHQRFGLDNCDNLQNRGKPSIHLNEEPAIIVREPDATMQTTPQDNQLMSKHRVLRPKPQLRLDWRGQDGQNETEQSDHSASLGDSITSSTQIGFSVHTTVCGTQHDRWQRR